MLTRTLSGAVQLAVACLGRVRPRRAPAWAIAAVVLVAASPCRAQPADYDETFPPSELTTGKSIGKERCQRLPYAVWVEHQYGDECIRYYPSSGVDGAKQAVFFFHGDRLEGRFPITGAYRDNSVKAQLALAERSFKAYGVPFIMMARPGAYGSSGEHGRRRLPKEFHSINAAVDAIKAKHRIDRVVLAGQSGGATMVAALLTLGRTDVSCAVATSGVYAVLERAELYRRLHGARSQPGTDTTGHRNVYDVIDHVAGIKPDPRRRILIIGDPKDQTTAFSLQRSFVERVKEAGHPVDLIEAKARGTQHHSLTHVAFKAAPLCAVGMPTEELVRSLSVGEKKPD